MRLFLALSALLAVAACDLEVPDSGAIAVAEAESEAVVEENKTETVDPAVVAETQSDESDLNTDNPSISDTQNFASLIERESIESDAARLAAQKEQFAVIEPTDLPSRTGEFNVAEFALATDHPVGEKKYRRFSVLGALGAKQACRRYQVADEAQQAFLQAGGPDRDPKNLDPDGDGYACDWSPDRYRKFLQ